VTAGANNDSLVDTPTPYGTDTGAGGEVRSNYCTLNPLDSGYIAIGTLSNGNLNYVQSSSGSASGRGTFGVSSGKWYWEYTQLGGNSSVGIVNESANLSTYVGGDANGWSYFVGGQKYTNNASASYGASYTTNDVIGIALDLDAGTLVFYKNGVSQGTAFSSLSGTMFPAISTSGISNVSCVLNFGQRPFAYTAPSGFKALCTQNLPDPTIADGSQYFNTVLYTGTGVAQSITGVGFQPDWVWQKARAEVANHRIADSVRGVDKVLYSSSTSAEATTDGVVDSFDSDGFTGGGGDVVGTGLTAVAWCWNAGGSNATNTDGTITSTVRANTTAGFSIVSYTGNGTNGATTGHGLGVTPSFIIIKNRDGTNSWRVYHSILGTSPTESLYLDLTSGATADTNIITGVSSSTMSLGISAGNASVNGSGDNYIALCFSEVTGYSKFSSYTGNGSTNGPFVYCGFRPAWIMWKRTDSTGGWTMIDADRSTYNEVGVNLAANSSNAESPYGQSDILSNGFKMRNTYSDSNASGGTFIFAAFAENPFKYSLAR
jgi:hypothetical protein